MLSERNASRSSAGRSQDRSLSRDPTRHFEWQSACYNAKVPRKPDGSAWPDMLLTMDQNLGNMVSSMPRKTDCLGIVAGQSNVGCVRAVIGPESILMRDCAQYRGIFPAWRTFLVPGSGATRAPSCRGYVEGKYLWSSTGP